MSTNIQDALLRISNLRDQLASHGKTLGLNLTDSAAEGFTETKSTLQQVVDEFNKIVRGTITPTGDNTTVNNSIYQVDNLGTVEFSAGYYPESWIVTGLNSDADQAAAVAKAIQDLYKEIQASVTAAPEDVPAGVKIPVISPKEEGSAELKIEYVQGTLTNTTGAKASTDNKLIVSAHGHDLTTDITYNTSAPTVNINVLKDSESDAVVVENNTLASGYYPENVTVGVNVLEDTTNINAINVRSAVTVGSGAKDAIVIEKTSSKEGDTYGMYNQDYIKKVVIKEGSASVQVTIADGKVSLSKELLAGWISDGIVLKDANGDEISSNESGKFELEIPRNTGTGTDPIEATLSVDEDGKITITVPEGYYDEDQELELTDGNGHNIPVIVNDPEAENSVKVVETTKGGEGDDKDDDTFKVEVPAGYNPQAFELDLGKSEVTVTNSSDNTITSKNFIVKHAQGYSTSDSSVNYSIQEAKLKVEYNPTSDSLVLSTNPEEGKSYQAGWFEGGSYPINGIVDSILRDQAQATLNLDYATVKVFEGGTKEYTDVYNGVNVDLSDLIAEIDQI